MSSEMPMTAAAIGTTHTNRGIQLRLRSSGVGSSSAEGGGDAGLMFVDPRSSADRSSTPTTWSQPRRRRKGDAGARLRGAQHLKLHQSRGQRDNDDIEHRPITDELHHPVEYGPLMLLPPAVLAHREKQQAPGDKLRERPCE